MINQLINTFRQRRHALAICLGLVAITFVVFGQTAGFKFVNYDDPAYVYQNPIVMQGLTFKGMAWALTYGNIGHWHPVTWLTHMADCQMYGLWPGGHHLTNVLLQALAACLLFLALKELTGKFWRCAFVAAVFAIHPLRVESVAWISERKDVLSGVFFMLTLWAYARNARQPSRGRFVRVALWFGIGLLCKNTLVTLPFVLLLLDWWPLGRMKLKGAFMRLVKEKIPLFLLSVGSCVATFLVPETVSERMPFLERAGNAVVAYVIYLRQLVFPAGLAVPYLSPPAGQPPGKIAAALVVLAGISTLVAAMRKSRPCLLVGWLWYLGMTLPTIGLVQISYYFHADRYTYLPEIGLTLAAAWAVGDWSEGWKYRKVVSGAAMVAVLAALMTCSLIQTGYWKSDESLWTHTLACDPNNYLAQINLGNALDQDGKVDDAIECFQNALLIKPAMDQAHYDLAFAFQQQGRLDQAIEQYQQALNANPNYAQAHNGLGVALREKGRVDEAIAHYETALQINPAYAEAHLNLGNVLLQQGKLEKAIANFQGALEINPSNAKIHQALGLCHQRLGQFKEAISQYENSLQIQPGDLAAENNLAWLLATCPDANFRNGSEALELASQANETSGGNNPVILGTLAAACAETGHYSDAVENAQRALRLAQAQSKMQLLAPLQTELKLYQAGHPFHTPPPTR